jgi:hypothetical protein
MASSAEHPLKFAILDADFHAISGTLKHLSISAEATVNDPYRIIRRRIEDGSGAVPDETPGCDIEGALTRALSADDGRSVAADDGEGRAIDPPEPEAAKKADPESEAAQAVTFMNPHVAATLFAK